MFCLTSFFKFVFLQADPSLWRSCTGRQASYYHLHCHYHLHHFCIIIHHINVSYIICLMVLSRDVLIFQPGFRADSHEVFLFFFAMSILHMIWTTVIYPPIHLKSRFILDFLQIRWTNWRSSRESQIWWAMFLFLFKFTMEGLSVQITLCEAFHSMLHRKITHSGHGW